MRISVAVPTPGSTYSSAAARAGPSSSSPADDTPPPIATTSGSKVLITLATPMPSRRPSVATQAIATSSPSLAPRRPRRGRRPSRVCARRRPSAESGCAAAASRARRSSTCPAASDSSEPGCGKRVGARDRLVERDQRLAELAGGAGGAAVGAAVDHDAAADARADRDHHQRARRRSRPSLVVRLGERRDGRVVVDEDRQPRRSSQDRAQRHVGERDVRRASARARSRSRRPRGCRSRRPRGELAGGDLADLAATSCAISARVLERSVGRTSGSPSTPRASPRRHLRAAHVDADHEPGDGHGDHAISRFAAAPVDVPARCAPRRVRWRA